MITMSARPMNANVKVAVWWMGLVALYLTVALQLSFFIATLMQANINWRQTFEVTNNPSQPLVSFHNPFAILWAIDTDHRWLPICSLVAAIALIRYLHLKLSICAGDRNRLHSLSGRPVPVEGKTYSQIKAEHEQLGKLLRACEVITDEQLRQAQDLSNKTQRFLGDCFVSFAWITPEQLADAQQVQAKVETRQMDAVEAKAILLSQKMMHDALKAEALARKQHEEEEAKEEIDHYAVAAARLKPNPVAIPAIWLQPTMSCQSAEGLADQRPDEPALWTLEASEQAKRCLQVATESGENEIGHQREQPFTSYDFAAAFPSLPSRQAPSEFEAPKSLEQPAPKAFNLAEFPGTGDVDKRGEQPFVPFNYEVERKPVERSTDVDQPGC